MQFKIILFSIITNYIKHILHYYYTRYCYTYICYNFDVNKKEAVQIVNKRILFFVSRAFHKFRSHNFRSS